MFYLLSNQHFLCWEGQRHIFSYLTYCTERPGGHILKPKFKIYPNFWPKINGIEKPRKGQEFPLRIFYIILSTVWFFFTIVWYFPPTCQRCLHLQRSKVFRREKGCDNSSSSSSSHIQVGRFVLCVKQITPPPPPPLVFELFRKENRLQMCLQLKKKGRDSRTSLPLSSSSFQVYMSNDRTWRRHLYPPPPPPSPLPFSMASPSIPLQIYCAGKEV